MFKDDVSPIGIPEVSKTFKKARVIRPFFSSTTCVPKDTNSGSPTGLRTRKAWQRRYRTAEGCKEITSAHRLRLDHISHGDESTPPTATMALPVSELMVPPHLPRAHWGLSMGIATGLRDDRPWPIPGAGGRVAA